MVYESCYHSPAIAMVSDAYFAGTNEEAEEDAMEEEATELGNADTGQNNAVLFQLRQQQESVTARKLMELLSSDERLCILPEAPVKNYTFVSSCQMTQQVLNMINRSLDALVKDGRVQKITGGPAHKYKAV